MHAATGSPPLEDVEDVLDEGEPDVDEEGRPLLEDVPPSLTGSVPLDVDDELPELSPPLLEHPTIAVRPTKTSALPIDRGF